MASKSKPAPLKDRIVACLQAGGGKLSYWDLMHALWPEDQYPRAYRCSSNGGPPGVAMVFGRALREMKASGCLEASSSGDRIVHLIQQEAA